MWQGHVAVATTAAPAPWPAVTEVDSSAADAATAAFATGAPIVLIIRSVTLHVSVFCMLLCMYLFIHFLPPRSAPPLCRSLLRGRWLQQCRRAMSTLQRRHSRSSRK